MNRSQKGVENGTWRICILEMIGVFADPISNRFFRAWDCGEDEYADDATEILAYACTLLANNGDANPHDAVLLAADVYQVLLEGMGVCLCHVGFFAGSAPNSFGVYVRYRRDRAGQ